MQDSRPLSRRAQRPAEDCPGPHPHRVDRLRHGLDHRDGGADLAGCDDRNGADGVSGHHGGKAAAHEASSCCCNNQQEENVCDKDNKITSIKVLGAGCKSCHKQFENVKKAVEELGLEIEVEYITDMEKVMAFGVMSMPAIVGARGIETTIPISLDEKEVSRLHESAEMLRETRKEIR